MNNEINKNYNQVLMVSFTPMNPNAAQSRSLPHMQRKNKALFNAMIEMAAQRKTQSAIAQLLLIAAVFM